MRSVDVKPLDEWYQRFDEVENLQLDLSERQACLDAMRGVTHVFNLAADMGGMGFIENNKALCMLSVLINTHMLMAARDAGVERYFFSSSACVYAADKQTDPDVDGAARGGRLSGHARGRLRLGEAVLASGCAGTSARTSGSRPASPATTTSTARTAPGTAAARRRPRRSAAR